MATTRNKVMWQEGMLMRPHHFQQQQRYNDYLDNQRFRAMNDLSWGFTELTLNNELLAQGKIMIDSASGTLPDGTVFSIPDQDALPDPLHPQHFPDERSRNIYLALPVASDVRNEISDGRRIGRYRLNYADVRDLHSEEGDTRTLTLGQLTPRIMSGAEDMSAYITLPLCRISDRHADGSLTLDDDFIPSCQNIQVSKKLRVYLKEVQGAIGGRASDLANRIGSPAQSGIADVAEFMMLQLLNRNQTRFTHHARRSQLHPEDFYLDLAGLLGELMTFTEPSRLPCPLDVYDHHDLTKTFKTLLPATAAPAEASSMAGVAVAVATTTPPDATATLQAMQSCRRESAALERLDCYDRLLAPLSPSGFDGALVKAGFVGEAWTRATEQEKRREGNTTELLVTQVPGERPTVVITTPAIGHVPPRPVLMFSCVDNITRMQVALMHPLDVHDIAVTLNADNRALRSHWFVRENGTLLESSRGLSGIDEIKQLFGAKTLTVDTGADNAAGKLTFNIDGLARAIAPLRDACHWAGE